MQLKSDVNIKGDLGGAISVRFKPGSTFSDYCVAHIENFDLNRFEILAVRFYYAKETIITVYAIDKNRLEGSNFNKNKLPVKKFKLAFPFLKDILPFIEECNFTLTTGHYPLEDMEVINK
jgi:hypothetical protein